MSDTGNVKVWHLGTSLTYKVVNCAFTKLYTLERYLFSQYTLACFSDEHCTEKYVQLV